MPPSTDMGIPVTNRRRIRAEPRDGFPDDGQRADRLPFNWELGTGRPR